MLEDQVKRDTHLLNQETVEIRLELISLLRCLRLSADRLLMFFNSQPEHTLLELVSEHDVAGACVELSEELFLALLPLLPQLCGVVICRR